MSRRIFVTIILMTLSSISGASASAAEVPTFKSIHAAADVAPETDLQSAFWRGAVPVFMEKDDWGSPMLPEKTEVLSRWTKDNLYFLFICPFQEMNLKPNPELHEETNKLWNWDVAEVFIGSDFSNIRRYKEFEMSPRGEWIDLDINLDSPHHEDGWVWNSGFKVAARIDKEKKIWYGAMRIPFSALSPLPPREGTVFRVNLFRTEGAAPHTKSIVWQPPMSETFHTPERFGRLELVTTK